MINNKEDFREKYLSIVDNMFGRDRGKGKGLGEEEKRK